MILKNIIESFVFFPNHQLIDTPESFHIPYQDIYLSTSKEKYHGWYMESKSPYVILFFHGNAGNISTRLSFVEKLYSQSFSICLFDYPGFGKSQGKPTEETCIQSALLFYDFLHKKKNFSHQNIILWGESIGGSIASHVALTTQNPILILQSTFTDIKEIIHKTASKIPYFIYKSIGFHTKHYLKKRHQFSKMNNNIKTLILHSREDELIPFTHAEILHKYATDLIECNGKHSSPKIDIKRIVHFILQK
jgi:hypothetical protein